MSRSTRRIGPPVGRDPWPVVDQWADQAVDPVALRARWSARATPVRGVDRFVDVASAEAAGRALDGAGLRASPIRPSRRALGRTGEIAYAVRPALLAALRDAGVELRLVTGARRYVWRGALTGRTFCEVSHEAEPGILTVQAWYEPVWTDSLQPRADRVSGARRRPRRFLQARASINRLLDDLGAPPIPTG